MTFGYKDDFLRTAEIIPFRGHPELGPIDLAGSDCSAGRKDPAKYNRELGSY